MVTPPRSASPTTGAGDGVGTHSGMENHHNENQGMHSNTAHNSFVPHVSDVEVPTVGKTFDTEDDAFLFYNTYAKVAGFSVRKANCVRNKAGDYRLWVFTCSREGVTNESYQMKRKYSHPRTGERNRGHTRCKCVASMSVKRLVKEGGWIVSKFEEKHSHPLESPGKVQFLPSHRTMSKSKKKLVDQFSEANVSIPQQYRYFEICSGGPSSVGFRERDLRNYKRDLRQVITGHDAEALIYFFEREKTRNLDSYYVYDTETVQFEDGKEERVFTRCFWADSVSRNAYGHFGDVLVFDTTYNTNSYSMILATFVGVNNHRQTVVFGSGLLSDETTDSFRWLFSQFLRCMPDRGAPPNIIITDQDQAIGNAVSELLPSTMHRLCLWHIENKFSEKLGIGPYAEHKDTLYSVIHDTETVSEFENRWGQLMSTTQLGANEWLRNMYEIRAKWVPPYVRHIFSAGMSSSQRVESNHSFFKRFVISKNSLGDFIIKYWRAIDHQRNEEKQSDYIDHSQVPRSVKASPMEDQMARIYTKTIYLRFTGELQQSSWYKSKKISATEDGKFFEVRRTNGDGLSDRARTLTWWTGSDFVTCSCKLFEFHGYPCRHILRLLDKKEVMYLPERYILKRWTKKAKDNPIFQQTREINPEQTIAMRRSTLSGLAMELVEDGSISEDISKFALSEMLILGRKIKDRISAGPVVVPSTTTSREDPLNVADPFMVRTKGSSKRLKSWKEKSMDKRLRSCSHCHVSGHDVRKCPQLHSSSQVVHEDENSQDVYHQDLSSMDVYRPDLSNMDGGVESSPQDNFYTDDGLDDNTVLGEDFW